MSLRERRDIVELCGSSTSPQGVLFSVVQVKGSSYRQPGARMAVLADGRTAGTISGGCLEADLLRRAAWTVRDGAVVEHFSTAFDETADVPYGLGCGGDIDVLAEPLQTAEAVALLQAMSATLQGEERTVVTLYGSAARQHAADLCRVVLDARSDVLFASDALPTEEVVRLRSLARAGGAAAGARGLTEDAGEAVFVEFLQVPQRLVVFGAGEDARPVARLAAELGWQPVVVDTRSQRLSTARFPGALCVQATRTADVPVLATDAVVLMTHSYVQDRALLAELLPQSVAYLGLLGARHRSALLLSEAADQAGVSLARAVEVTHAPVGLDLGGEGPEAVALAIVAEVQQVIAQRGRPVQRTLGMEQVLSLLSSGPAASYMACAFAGGSAEDRQVTQ